MNLSVSQARLRFCDTWKELKTVTGKKHSLKITELQLEQKTVSYLLDRATERVTISCSVNVLVAS